MNKSLSDIMFVFKANAPKSVYLEGLELPLEKLVLNDLQLEWTVIWQLLNALPK